MTTYKSEREMYVDLYGEEEGTKLVDRKEKANAIVKEALALVERRWAEEFPDDDLSKPKKPYAYYWFINRPAGC